MSDSPKPQLVTPPDAAIEEAERIVAEALADIRYKMGMALTEEQACKRMAGVAVAALVAEGWGKKV